MESRPTCGYGGGEPANMWIWWWRAGQHVDMVVESRPTCGYGGGEPANMWIWWWRAGQHVDMVVESRPTCGYGGGEPANMWIWRCFLTITIISHTHPLPLRCGATFYIAVWRRSTLRARARIHRTAPFHVGGPVGCPSS